MKTVYKTDCTGKSHKSREVEVQPKAKLPSGLPLPGIEAWEHQPALCSEISITAARHSSGEADVLDRVIRDSIKARSLSIIATGLWLANMKGKSLYRDLGCRSMSQYIMRLCDGTKIDKSSIFKWLCIGAVYRRYQNELEQIGFSDGDGTSKLLHLERALENKQKRKVFACIKEMSLRDFISFSKTTPNKNASDGAGTTAQDNTICAGARFIVRINTKLNKVSFAYLRKVINIADEAMQQGEVILPVRLRNMEEARRFERASRRLIDKLRKRA